MSEIGLTAKADTPIIDEDVNSDTKSTKQFKVVRHKFSSQSSVFKIDFTHDEKKMPTERLDAHCKVLSVSCKTVEHFVTILKDKKFAAAINRSPQCFVLIAEVERVGMSDIESVMDDFPEDEFIDRPLIVQLGAKNSNSEIFFKDRKELKKVKLPKRPSEWNEFEGQTLDFSLLIQMLSSNFGGEIDGTDLLSCEFDETTQGLANLNFIDWAVNSDDSLSLRFLKLFFSFEDEVSLIERAVKKSSLDTIAALLNLPINYQTSGLEALPYLEGHSVRTLTTSAVAEDRIKVLKMLLKLVSDDCKKLLMEASELAFANKNWKSLKMLLENDAPFPSKITNLLDADDSELDNIKKLCLDRKTFCEAIKNNDREVVNKFIAENPAIKIGFNFSNHSALAVALKAGKISQKFDIYALLQYHQFIAPNDDPHKNFFNNLFPLEKQMITKARHQFYGSAFDSHVFYIYSKSRLGFKYPREKEEEYFEKIKEYLMLLSKIEGINPILRVIEHSDSLTVTFDFEAFAAHKLDMLSGPSTLGVCYSQSGRIYIGAKGFTNEVVATLAHELGHYAMHILFNNDCKPFGVGDHQNRLHYQSIVSEYELIDDHVPIMGSLFDCYDAHNYESELIVRVPQIMAHYRECPKQVKRYAEKYEKLFKFYESQVLEVIEKFISNPEEFHHVRRVQQLNEQLGSFSNGWSDPSNRKSTKLFDESFLESQNLLLVSNVPEITECCVLQSLLKTKSAAEITGAVLLTTLKNFENEYFLGSFESLANATLTFVITIKDDIVTNSQAWKFIRSFPKTKFVIICHETNSENVKTSLSSLNCIEQFGHHEWNDLSDKSKHEVLNKEISFQNSSVKLNLLVDSQSPSLQHLPVEEFFKKQTPVIGSHIQGSKGYDRSFYIERTFYEALDTGSIGMLYHQNVDMEAYCQQKKWPIYRPTDTEKILNFSQTNQYVIVSDYAGKGKSTILSHLAAMFKEKQPDLLVIRLNLNEHGETLKNSKSGIEFVVKQVLKAQSSFEVFLFEELLKKGKAFVMLDGFDEIAPFYNEECVNILESLISDTKAKIWISTRPHLSTTLENLFNGHPVYLLPFTETDQINFMKKFWKSALKTNEDAQLEHCAKEVIAKLKSSLDQSQLGVIGIPLQTRMVAEIFLNDVREFLSSDAETASFAIPRQFNMLSMYKSFISCKIKIVQSEKGELVGAEKADLEADGVNVLSIHEKMALNEIFDQSNECDMEKDQLQRYGLITFVGDHPKFVHRTFSEYLVANFIIKNFKRLDEQILYNVIFDSYKYNVILNLLEIELKASDRFITDVPFMKKLAVFIEVKMPLNLPDDAFLIHRCIYRLSETMALFLLECMKYVSKHIVASIFMAFVADGCRSLIQLAASYRFQSIIKKVVQIADERQALPMSELLLWTDSDGLNAFQKAFLVDLSNQNLRTFYKIFKRYFSNDAYHSLADQFWNVHDYDSVVPVELVTFPSESLKEICDLRLKIVREFTGITDDELLEDNHLFSMFFMKIQRFADMEELLEWTRSNLVLTDTTGGSLMRRLFV